LALIELKSVSVEYPIYGYRHDSIKTTLIEKFARLTGLGDKPLIGETRTVTALKDISFKAIDGDKVGLIGPNGSGKTTLLYTINDTLEPASGEILVRGRTASMLNLSCGVDPNLSGRENIDFRLKILNIPKGLKTQISEDIIETSGLNEFINLPLRIYSSGMVARLLFCMATAINSDIVLMDEWLSAGDEEFQETAQKRLKNFVNKSSILVLASHNKEFIQNTCNKIIVLENGTVKEQQEFSPIKT